MARQMGDKNTEHIQQIAFGIPSDGTPISSSVHVFSTLAAGFLPWDKSCITVSPGDHCLLAGLLARLFASGASLVGWGASKRAALQVWKGTWSCEGGECELN